MCRTRSGLSRQQPPSWLPAAVLAGQQAWLVAATARQLQAQVLLLSLLSPAAVSGHLKTLLVLAIWHQAKPVQHRPHQCCQQQQQQQQQKLQIIAPGSNSSSGSAAAERRPRPTTGQS
jgi:hypothetical protein